MRMLFLIIILSTAYPSMAQEKQCMDFKQGKFRYLDQDYSDLHVERNDSIETSTYMSFGLWYKSKVTWVSECTYTTTVFEVSDPKFEDLIGTKFNIEIIAIYQDKITCESTSDGMKVKKVMQKVE